MARSTYAPCKHCNQQKMEQHLNEGICDRCLWRVSLKPEPQAETFQMPQPDPEMLQYMLNMMKTYMQSRKISEGETA